MIKDSLEQDLLKILKTFEFWKCATFELPYFRFNVSIFSSFQLSQPPEYIEERLTLYTKLKAEHDALIAQRAANESLSIKVTLPDGKVVDAESWKTTPYQIACGIRSVMISVINLPMNVKILYIILLARYCIVIS